MLVAMYVGKMECAQRPVNKQAEWPNKRWSWLGGWNRILWESDVRGLQHP